MIAQVFIEMLDQNHMCEALTTLNSPMLFTSKTFVNESAKTVTQKWTNIMTLDF